MYIFQTTATIEINPLIWIPIIVGIIGGIANVFTIIKVRNENKEKMATKGYVLEKVAEVETKVIKVENVIKEHKEDNIREHDRLTHLFDKIDGKLDRLIERSNP